MALLSGFFEGFVGHSVSVSFKNSLVFEVDLNGTTAGASHVCGKTGARQSIEGSIEYGAYSWATCGWTSNSGLSPTVCPTAAEAKMNIDPAARATRANCKDFCIVFLPRFLFAQRRIEPRRELMTLLGGAVAAWPLLRVPAAVRREGISPNCMPLSVSTMWMV